MNKNKHNKIRKDKTNYAVYLTMKKALNHPYTQETLDEANVIDLKTHRKGYDMDYMSVEHRLSQFFTSSWSGRVPQLKEKFGEQAMEIEKRMKKVFSCKGLAYKRKNTCQCHHPLCPVCYHRKLYKVIRDLKPYMSKESAIHVLSLDAYAHWDSTDLVFDGLEARAKRITREIGPFTEQWIRIPHLAYDKKENSFVASCVFIIVPIKRMIKSDLQPLYKKYEAEIDLRARGKLDASLDIMPELLSEFLYYDPLVLRNGGTRAMELWDRKTPGFKYRAKHACG